MKLYYKNISLEIEVGMGRRVMRLNIFIIVFFFFFFPVSHNTMLG